MACTVRMEPESGASGHTFSRPSAAPKLAERAHESARMQAFILLSLGQCELDAQNTPAYTLGRPAVAEMAKTAAQISHVERDFLAVPTAASARANLMHITSRPHVAGTPGDYAMAQFVRDQIKAANP